MPWVKGQSGNPGGQPKVTAHIRELAREHGQEAIENLVAIMRRGESDQVRLAACVALLDRGFGKPKQEVEHSGPDGAAIKHEHSVDAFIAELAKLRKRMEETELPDSE